jgi:alkylation response protein AidB-like acyl-CoA dehydrogenase
MDLSTKAEHYVEAIKGLTPQLEMLSDQIENEVHDIAARDHPASKKIYELVIANDLHRLTLPERWGGVGMTTAEYFPVLEEIAGINGALRMVVHGANGMWRLIHQYGTDGQKEEWLPRMAAGDTVTFALTEPGNGTGRDITTTAVRDGDDWVINGQKWLISFASSAKLIHLLAATGSDDRGKTLTCFLMPLGTPGVTSEPLPPTMGCRGAAHEWMYLTDVRLPHDAILGKVDGGLDLGLRGFLDVSRLGIAGTALGICRKSLELATQFARDRVTFDKPIASRQAVRLSLAEMATETYALQAAVRDTCRLFDQGQPIKNEAAMCKYLGIETVGKVTDRALRLHGGIGYTQMHRIERLYRDARALWFEEGTAEIQKLIIGSSIVSGRLTI